MELIVQELTGEPVGRQRVEMVERKGLGHPDTLCDALAEQLSLALSRFYLEHFGLVLHHNVDKLLLRGGASRPAFGGGEVVEPIELYLAGRATCAWGEVRVPVEELAVETCRRWLGGRLRALDPEKHVVIHPLLRPGSRDLVELFLRQHESGVWLANDTSCGVGFAPLSELERVVLGVEARLNAAEVKARQPALGEDVKVMGVRVGGRMRLTVACAMIDRHLADLAAYLEARREAAALVLEQARALTSCALEVEVNTADDPARGSVYLSVTGSSAEAGDDGEAGRGNRVNGLITPYRPATLESVAGKNPVTHVGKLYNVAASRIAAELVEALPGVSEVYCSLVSQIGRPVADPQVADLRLRCEGPAAVHAPRVREIVGEHLAGLGSLWRALLEGRVGLDRWPLG